MTAIEASRQYSQPHAYPTTTTSPSMDATLASSAKGHACTSQGRATRGEIRTATPSVALAHAHLDAIIATTPGCPFIDLLALECGYY